MSHPHIGHPTPTTQTSPQGGSGDRNSPRVTDRVPVSEGSSHPTELPLTWDNTTRVTEGDRSSREPHIKTRMRAWDVNPTNPEIGHPRSPGTWTRPPWLYDGPLTNIARLISCNRCRRPVLEALADGVMPARIDLHRLTPTQELQYLLDGGIALRLAPNDDSLAAYIPRRLLFRWPPHIRAHPGRGVPLHNCDRTWGPIDRSLIRTRRSTSDTQEPTW